MNIVAVLAEIDDVFARCGASTERPFVPTAGKHRTVVGDASEIASSCLACIERNAPQRSYVERARGQVNTHLTATNLNRLLGILASVRRDIEAGYIRTLEQRARETVFDDLLELAAEINKLHPAPAIVLAVSVLEEHVRKRRSPWHRYHQAEPALPRVRRSDHRPQEEGGALASGTTASRRVVRAAD